MTIRETQQKFKAGLIGTKIGMTQLFTDDGSLHAVTVLQVGPCVVTGIRERDKDGYSAAELAFGEKKQQRLNKAALGKFTKIGKGVFNVVQELRCDAGTLGWQLGQELKVGEVFQQGDFVDVSGTSIGKGFAGVVKKYHVKGQPATRGTHEYERHIGAVGCRKFPGRIQKNKRMPGHLGNASITVQNLKVLAVKPEENLLLIEGGVPGAKGALLTVRLAAKKINNKVSKAA